ncbi:hypothetical protein [Georgenia subflava]|uniref:Uncharacterized protein n=1 Tax=Georgenia subflava TaxID=1622177 RepID=A0A6N7ESD9_9MICO|nr:hypothetical protein [Georgenia subflava]MPV39026.1 hypothetical protein [Georgenia subflava]
MTGALIGALLAALCALVVLLMLVAERRPEGGWAAWLRGSLDAWRSDELSGENLRVRRSDVRDTPVEDLFSLGEPVDEPAYTRPEELVARLEHVRGAARR